MAFRAFLVWGLATAVTTSRPGCSRSRWAAWSSSKAYGVTRAAAVPRLLPESLTLVKANGRISAGRPGRPPASRRRSPAWRRCFGAEWSLRYAFVLFVLATIWAIRLPARVDSDAGEDQAVLIGSARSRTGSPADADPGHGVVRPARQLRAALALGLPDDVHGVPAAREPDRRLAARGAARHRDRCRRLRQRDRHRARVGPQEAEPCAHRGAGPAGRRGDGAAGRLLLRRADPRPARAHRRPGPVPGQALARLDDPARRPRTRAHERLRPQRHHAPARLGDRRLRRHRAAAEPHPRPRRGQRDAGRLGGAGAGQLAQPQAPAYRGRRRPSGSAVKPTA